MEIIIENLSKKYKTTWALNHIDLTLPQGSFTAILGPSGCGKTTLMRCLAGFLELDSGTIRFGHQDVTHLPPQRRGTAMVFQNYALWPHMTVFENIAYGLKLRKFSKQEIKKKVYAIVEKVEIDTSDIEKRRPSEYSGGQQQRIALARALVLEPKLLLMDEPLSNLDAKVRQRLRVEIRKLQKDLGITAIYVTHDQDEALSMADQVVLMSKGSIEQFGTPKEIYHNPKSYFVSHFLGNSNTLHLKQKEENVFYLGNEEITLPESSVRGKSAGGNYDLVLRSEDIRLKTEPSADPRDLSFKVTLRESLFIGSGYRHWVQAGGQNLFVLSGEHALKPGDCYATLPASKCFVFPQQEGGEE